MMLLCVRDLHILGFGRDMMHASGGADLAQQGQHERGRDATYGDGRGRHGRTFPARRRSAASTTRKARAVAGSG